MSTNTKPFLRWAGGKGWLKNSIIDFLPATFSNYHEPFVGGGAIFIHLKSNDLIQNKTFLADTNYELINAYRIVKSHPKELFIELTSYENSNDFYYQIRNSQPKSPLKRAAKFIFLNKTSFNGIYRVNQNGQYNVPYGNKKYKIMYDELNFDSLSKCFKNTYFSCRDFEFSLMKAKKNDLVFLDPPYTIAHQYNGFVKYNQKIYSWEDQLRLLKCIQELRRKKAYFILTNAAHESIFKLYKNIASIYSLERPSVVGGKNAIRQNYNEYVITNT